MERKISAFLSAFVFVIVGGQYIEYQQDSAVISVEFVYRLFEDEAGTRIERISFWFCVLFNQQT